VDISTPAGTPQPQPKAPIEDLGELPESTRTGHPQIGRLELAAVGVGGAAGALGRVGLERAWPSAPGTWPWTTLAVNIFGALLLGTLMATLRRRGPISIPTYRLLGTGFCGALTTFSTMQIELLQMLDRARYGLAAGYVLVSVVGGYAAVSLAAKLIGARAGATTLAVETEAQA
jgi:fluoride exporter